MYFFCFVTANIDISPLLQNPNALLSSLPSLVIGVFALSPALGYVIYQFYDGLLYNRIANSKNRRTLELLDKLALETNFSRIDSWEAKKELIDFTLYSGGTEPHSKISDKLLETLRGFWSHAAARIVSAIFVPIASFGLFVIFLTVVSALHVSITWSAFRVPQTVFTICLITILSLFIGYPAKRPIKEAFMLEEYVFRVKEGAVRDYMKLETGTGAKQNTKKDTKEESKDTEKNQEVIKSLADLVDKNFKNRRYTWSRVLILLADIILSLTVILLVFYISYLSFGSILSVFGQLSSEAQASVLLAEVAIIIALMQLPFSATVILSSHKRLAIEELVDLNYGKMNEKVNKEQRPLLKALIMMKSKNPDFDLSQLYDDEKTRFLFAEKELLERLFK